MHFFPLVSVDFLLGSLRSLFGEGIQKRGCKDRPRGNGLQRRHSLGKVLSLSFADAKMIVPIP